MITETIYCRGESRVSMKAAQRQHMFSQEQILRREAEALGFDLKNLKPITRIRPQAIQQASPASHAAPRQVLVVFILRMNQGLL